uniref:DOMON domain-containing protein n=1 Tax=Plectus sambesii TaxID=2011161 RepID=A0A914UZ08_9BILA
MALSALVFGVLLWLVNRATAQEQCYFSDNGYNLRWRVDDQDNVHFDFKYERFPSDPRWTGVAFGYSMKSGLDAIIIKSLNGQVVVNDQSVLGYAPAVPDRINNVNVISARLEEGTLTATFSRPLAAGDPESDHDIHGCTNWQFVTNANILDGLGSIRQHTTRPVTQRICVEECRGEPAAGFGRPPPRGPPGVDGASNGGSNGGPLEGHNVGINGGSNGGSNGGQNGGSNGGPFSGGAPIPPAPIVPLTPINPVSSASIDCGRPDPDWCKDYFSNFFQWATSTSKAADTCASLKSISPMCCRTYHEQCG